jgi:hypothetical protein
MEWKAEKAEKDEARRFVIAARNQANGSEYLLSLFLPPSSLQTCTIMREFEREMFLELTARR